MTDFNTNNLKGAGISPESAGSLIRELETSGSELHGIVVLRHGKLVFEGYWAPYTPNTSHGCQSLTKTMTGTGLGAALQEGILSLDDRLIDIFPEYAPLTYGEPYWDELRVRHIATMSAGMDTQPKVTSPTWQKDFFTMDIVHKPGTAFFYNSIACSMVGACIKKRTGLGLVEFLTPRVFDKIGIDTSCLKWHCHPDGLENGSGGLISTPRNNALMMELYRKGGKASGEQILSKQWVDFALQVENPFTAGKEKYGGMMWVWRDGFFVADGAMGQWSILVPDKDMVISLTQTISGDEANNKVRQALFNFVDSITDDCPMWTSGEEQQFNAVLSGLAIPKPKHCENVNALHRISGKKYTVVSGTAHFFADDLTIFDEGYLARVSSFGFDENNGDLMLTVTALGKTVTVKVGMKGSRAISHVEQPTINPADTLCASGAFLDDNTLQLEIRWLESCRVHYITFHFGDNPTVTTHRVKVGGFDVDDETAVLRSI